MTTDQPRYSCQVCDRDDLTLTRNGRVRSHAADGKRASETNPACGGGSDYPVQSTEHHTHRFEYGDDGIHMAGSYCTVDDCGMIEPAEKPTPVDLPAPPNPFRDPAPGGVWDTIGVPDRGLPADRQFRGPRSRLPGGEYDSLPHDRNLGDAGVDQRVKPAPDSPHQKMVDFLEESDRVTAPKPAGPTSADDFLDDEGNDYAEPAQDQGRPYWPSRYDGECSNCFRHFDAGELIRKDEDGGYEAKECCGEGAAPQPDRPKSVARTLPVVRGRYKLPDPETGKPVSASRSSKFAEGIADSFALDQWRHRMILAGLVADPEILEKVASAMREKDPLTVVKEERSFLNKMAEQAMTAAGGDDRSSKGTRLHKFTEEVDAGQRALSDVPEDYRPDAAAYVHALNNCGFRPVKDLIERSVFCREMNVCGTFDRVLECIRDTEVVDLYGRPVQIHAGEFVIGDVKSGDNIKHPWLEIQIQEALYAHAINENGVAVQDEPGGPFRWEDLSAFGVSKVREDVGIVMHVPYGQAEAKLYFADLITGWRGAKICRDNKDFWKIKLPHVPVASYSVDPDAERHDPADPEEVPDLVTASPVLSVNDTEGDYVTCFCGSQWENIEIANAYDHDYEACGPDPDLPAPMPEVVNGSEIDPTVPDPDPEGYAGPNNIMEAVHRAKHAAKREVMKIVDYESTAGRITYDPAKGVATVYREQPDDTPPEYWDELFRGARTREEAVHRAKHAVQEARTEVRKIMDTHTPTATPSVPQWAGRTMSEWTEAFKGARTREEANDLWREAKQSGMPADAVKALVSLVKLEDPKAQTAVSRPGSSTGDKPVAEKSPAPETKPQSQDGPTLTQRAHSVTTKAEASAVWGEMNAEIKKLPEEKREAAREYRNKLAKIMADRLKAA